MVELPPRIPLSRSTVMSKFAHAVSLFGLAFGSVAAGGCGASSEDMSSTVARIRVAHLSPDAPAVDICVAQHGTTAFSGPFLAAAGMKTGLTYGQVTNYMEIAPAQYDVRIVAPGAKNCATPLGGLADITN